MNLILVIIIYQYTFRYCKFAFTHAYQFPTKLSVLKQLYVGLNFSTQVRAVKMTSVRMKTIRNTCPDRHRSILQYTVYCNMSHDKLKSTQIFLDSSLQSEVNDEKKRCIWIYAHEGLKNHNEWTKTFLFVNPIHIITPYWLNICWNFYGYNELLFLFLWFSLAQS